MIINIIIINDYITNLGNYLGSIYIQGKQSKPDRVAARYLLTLAGRSSKIDYNIDTDILWVGRQDV